MKDNKRHFQVFDYNLLINELLIYLIDLYKHKAPWYDRSCGVYYPILYGNSVYCIKWFKWKNYLE